MRGQGRYITWDENGMPKPAFREIFAKEQIDILNRAALSADFEPRQDTETEQYDEERFRGMTNAEVGAIKLAENYARGDIESAKYLLDRVLGKPKQQVEQLSVNASYAEFLEELARQQNQNQQIEVTEVEPKQLQDNQTLLDELSQLHIMDAEVDYAALLEGL
jgi:hypothetical protein